MPDATPRSLNTVSGGVVDDDGQRVLHPRLGSFFQASNIEKIVSGFIEGSPLAWPCSQPPG